MQKTAVLALQVGSCSLGGAELPWLGRSTGLGQDPPGKDGWIPLFNGKDLDGWKPKIKGYDAGDNFGNTFRVENGVLKVCLRQVFQVRRQVRAPLLQDPVFQLQAAHRVSLRRRPVPGRAELGLPQQRRHDPRPVAGIHEERPGVPRLDRGPVSGWQWQRTSAPPATSARRAQTS